MKIKYILIALAAGLLLAPKASAQDFQTGYFLGGYQYAFRMNPAIQNERGMFAIGLGNIGLGVASNSLGVGTFLYPVDGKLVTAFNDKVPASTFLGKLSKNGNSLGANAGLEALTLGFWRGSNFYTIDVRARVDARATIPYALFDFLKNGTTENTSFDMTGAGLGLDGMIEAAFGWSRHFNERLNVGARVKFLYGIASMQMKMDRLNAIFTDDMWSFRGQGSMVASSPAFTIEPDKDGNIYFKDLEFDGEKLTESAGLGAAVDLGVTYDILPWLTASASILDLGGLSWNREIYAVTPESGYTWDPSLREPIDLTKEGSSPMDEELDNVTDELKNMLAFRKQASPGAGFKMLPLRAYLGLEARLPSYPRLSLGLLGSITHSSIYTWSDARASVNWSPLNWLSFSGSTGFSTLGESCGFAVNFHPAGINLFIGSDFVPFKIIPFDSLIEEEMDEVPALAPILKHTGFPTGHLNANLYIGLSLAIGRRHLTPMHTPFVKVVPEEVEAVLDAPLVDVPQEVEISE